MKFDLLILLSLFVSTTNSFSPSRPTNVAFARSAKNENVFRLNGMIRAEDEDFTFDQGQGGVTLANESFIKMCGSVKHNPGSSESEVDDLLRYKKLTQVDDSMYKSALEKAGATLICSGKGKELFKDPGTTAVKEVKFGPDEAVKDAISAARSVTEADKLVINFLGGEDLILDQVITAINTLVLDLSPPTKAKISFNSMCHNSVPAGSASVTVFSTKGESESSAEGVEKSLARGEVYFLDGKWWTVAEEDVELAVA